MMWSTPRHLWRLITIAYCLARHNAFFIIESLPKTHFFLFVLRPIICDGAPGRPGERLAAALQKLGPTFVKLGQSLATRGDLIGEEVAQDLSQLQDKLPPFPASQARSIIEKELAAPIDSLFARFDDEPIAAASIAQVHRAQTIEGNEVAVKVLRPDIKAKIERDLAFFEWAADRLQTWIPALRPLRPKDMIAIFAQSTRRELDLRLEAAAASELAANCANDEGFRVPEVDWQRSASRVATFAYAEGFPVNNRQQLIDHGFDPDVIMENASKVFFNQVFRDGFFHGDMHPGNMLVDKNGTIVAMDFGIMGRIDADNRRLLADILVGFLSRDYPRVARSFYEAGFLRRLDELDTFGQACRAIGEPILNLPLAEISFGKLLGQVLSMAQDFDMQAQPQFLILQKTMVVAEGVGRLLNPNANMWQTAQPLVERWIIEHLGPKAQIKRVTTQFLSTARTLPRLIERLDERLANEQNLPQPTVNRRIYGFHWLSILFLGMILGYIISHIIEM